MTEINDYLRLLFARVGEPFCVNGHGKISAQSPEEIVNQVLELPERSKLQILAPIIRGKKGQHQKIERVQKEGYVRVRVDGEVVDVTEVPELDKNKKHNIEIVIDRIVVKEGIRSRLFDSVEAALHQSEGYVIIDKMDGEELLFSEFYACPVCGFTVPELEPRLFSFNAPFGSCPDCDGLGVKQEVDVDLVIPDETKTLAEGAISAWNPISSNYYPTMLKCMCDSFGIDMNTPWEKMSDEEKQIVLFGSGEREFHFYYVGDFGNVSDKNMVFQGVVNNIERRFRETSSDYTRETLRAI